MCGLFTIDTDYEKIKEQFGIHQIEPLQLATKLKEIRNAIKQLNPRIIFFGQKEKPNN